jgi:hypothetical protein
VRNDRKSVTRGNNVKGEAGARGRDVPDGLDSAVDLEGFSDGDATLGTELVDPQAEIGGGNTMSHNRNSVTPAVTKGKGREHERGRDVLDALDSAVDLEGLGDRNATLGAELVVVQAEIGGGNTVRTDRNGVTPAVTNVKWAVTQGSATYLMFSMVLLTLRASAMAIPPSGPSWLLNRLKSEGVTKGRSGMVLPPR